MNGLNLEGIRRITERIESVSAIEVLKHPQTFMIPLELYKTIIPGSVPHKLDLPNRGFLDSPGSHLYETVEFQMTQCVVTVDHVVGLGLALGDSWEKAYCFAVIDAAITGKHPKAAEMEQKFMRHKSYLASKQPELGKSDVLRGV